MYTGITYYCLALGDGFAPIVAKLVGEHNVEIRKGKTLFGTLSVFVISFVSAWIFSLLFHMELSIVFLLSVAALTCVTEFYGVKGLDNLFIEFFVFGYLVLRHYGLVSLPLQVVLIASPLLACIAIRFGAMTTDGGICGFFLFAFVGFFGEGAVPVVFIVYLFLAGMLATAVGKKVKKHRTGVSEGHKPRRAHQIVAVGLFSLISLILFRITAKPIFYYIYFLALTEQIADSIASDIGSLTSKGNVNIITFKPVQKGISGGVSWLGTGCALISSFLLLSVPLAVGVLSWQTYLAISLLAFAGTLVDSILGALVQALYRCSDCDSLTEERNHCNKPARLIKGFRMIDNVAVNFISGFVTCAMGCLLLLVG